MTAIVTQGDAGNLQLPDSSVDLIVTSPPYFGLRSYQDGGAHYDGQIGAEPTPAEYLDALTACTREWMRVLKPGGSIFVNLGDKYSGAQQQSHGRQSQVSSSAYWKQTNPKNTGIPAKSLMMLPQRYAIRCIDELGLIARAEIVWAKPNGLPESVTDRVRRSHEVVFHFVKSPRYYAAIDNIRQPHETPNKARPSRSAHAAMVALHGEGVQKQTGLGGGIKPLNPLGKLPGSVWSIPTAPLRVPDHLGVDHFAAYPPELVRRIILGWSPREVCTRCGEGRRPVRNGAWHFIEPTNDQARRAIARARDAEVTAAEVAEVYGLKGLGSSNAADGEYVDRNRDLGARLGGSWSYAKELRSMVKRKASGDACACPDTTAPGTPGVVLDPFGGTGTTALVASVHGRVGISVDLSADYCRLAQWRTQDEKQRAKVAGVKPKPARKPKLQPLAEVVELDVPGQLDLLGEGEWTA